VEPAKVAEKKTKDTGASKAAQPKPKEKANSSTYCGMKKGFLL